MPVYTYRCEKCGIQFDQTQKYSDPVLTKCPECGNKSLRKVYTPVGIVFKGSGFYATDHRSPSGSNHSPGAKHDESKTGETSTAPTSEPKADTAATATGNSTSTTTEK